MARFFAALLAASLITASAHATLALLIPTRDGFVVAADSRLTYLGSHCDGTSKILVPSTPSRTVAIVTGDSIFVQPPNSKGLKPCEWLASAPRLLDINTIVTDFLARTANEADPTALPLADLAAACVHATQQFQQSYPAALRSYAGKEIFSVVVASYDPGTATTTLSSFVVRLAAAGRIESARRTQTKINGGTSHAVYIYGETDWLNRAVYKGPGRRQLTAATLDFLQAHTPVRDVTLGQAQSVAANVMQAATRTAALNPPPSGIGGQIHLMAIGSNPVPQELPSHLLAVPHP